RGTRKPPRKIALPQDGSSDTSLRQTMSPKLSPAPLLDLPYLLAAGLQTKTAEPTWFHHISVQADRVAAGLQKRPGRERPGLNTNQFVVRSIHRRDDELGTILDVRPRDRSRRRGRATKKSSGQFIVGMTNSAPSLMPARATAAEGEDAQPRNRPVSSSSG
ncbi:hypothetical protein, partial [Mesorhizobium sp.]|uniref:hypothetical protein n=1 Tax=Mesorhizobium sp. TaxID=1871066 RepID=UPI0025DCA35B